MCVCVGILGWPGLTLWPGSTFTSTLDGGGATLAYQLSNFSLDFLNLTFYNGTELIANLSTEGYKMDVNCDDPKCELATVQWQVPVEGLYHMCYSFSSVVTQNQFPPNYDFPPNCTEVTQVVVKKRKYQPRPQAVSHSAVWTPYLTSELCEEKVMHAERERAWERGYVSLTFANCHLSTLAVIIFCCLLLWQCRYGFLFHPLEL